MAETNHIVKSLKATDEKHEKHLEKTDQEVEKLKKIISNLQKDVTKFQMDDRQNNLIIFGLKGEHPANRNLNEEIVNIFHKINTDFKPEYLLSIKRLGKTSDSRPVLAKIINNWKQ